MPGQFDDTAFKIGITIAVVVILVVPAAALLLVLDLVRWLRKRDRPMRRGFEVKPVPPAAHKP